MFQYHLKAFIITEIISNLNTTRESVTIDFSTAQYINKETSNKIYKINTNGTSNLPCEAMAHSPQVYLLSCRETNVNRPSNFVQISDWHVKNTCENPHYN